MSKHTPGPWEVFTDGQSRLYVASKDLSIIAFVPDDATLNVYDNADLISAAPNLLSELQRYLPVIEYLESKPELWEEVAYPLGIATANGYRHAIAKATGETP